MDVEKIAVIDEEGKEVEYDILFTFDDEDTGKSFVLYYDSTIEDPMVYASIYDDDGNLFEIEDPKEWDMVNEVFESFVSSEEDDDEDEDDDDEETKSADTDLACGKDQCCCEGEKEDECNCNMECENS